jgi:voltage-gated potassium channel
MGRKERRKAVRHSAAIELTGGFEPDDGVVGPRAQRAQELMNAPLMIAALLTLPTVILSETPEVGAMADIALVLNWGTWLVFAFNLVLMLALVPDRLKYLRHHPIDVIVVVFTPPVLPASLQALRALRLLRLLRLLELEKLSRSVFSSQGLMYTGLMTVVVALSGGTLFKAFEARNQEVGEWESIYWAITTMATLGSEIETTTVGSEIVAVVMLLTGLSFVSMLTGAIARQFLSASSQAEEADPEDPPSPSTR